MQSLRTKAPRIVLIMQSGMAYWFKLVEGEVVDSFSEHIPDNCHDGIEHTVHCPWLIKKASSEALMVELILDTTLDEVDRVGVAQGSNAVVNRYRKFMTLARLRRDYPKAYIYSLPVHDQGSVAALMHPAIPEHWTSWLLMLQSVNIVFHRVTTGSELAVHWSRHLHGYHFLVMGVADYERHLLVCDGAVLFLRTVVKGVGNEESMNGDVSTVLPVIDQSLEHLRTIIAHDVDAITVLKPRFSITPAGEQLSVLLAMLRDYGSESDAPMGRRNAECSSIRRSALRWLDTFKPSVSYVVATHRVVLAYRGSIAVAVIAAIVASIALFNGLESKRVMLQSTLKKAAVGKTEADLHLAMKAAFSHPRFAADSLFIADELSDSVLLEPQDLLEEIATAVTAVAGIQLDRLVWAVAGRDELYESVSYALDAIPARQSAISGEYSVVLQVELSGRVSAQTLNEQQTLLKDFMDELRRVRGAVDARILESPVDTALSSHVDVNSAGRYRVSLILGEIQ